MAHKRMQATGKPAPTTLLVRCNPHAARDHLGEPTAAFMFEGDPTRWVGAIVDFERSRAEKVIRFLFDEEADVRVPDTQYYRNGLQHGDIKASPNCEYTKQFAKLVADSDPPPASIAARK